MQNEKYLKEIIEKYSDTVYRIALTRCGIVENAEDVFQEVFMKFSEKMPKFKNEEHEKAWFIRVTINLTKNLKQSAWNRKVVALDENVVLKNEEKDDVYSVVCQLPQNYRTVIYLLYYEGYKVKEIAELMKTREGTVKTWLYRAREILREKLEGGFEDE
ncbi:MAG: sigma-70 family RNA polymerase sigma factor [Clostridia bacterium]|nr:sigma-70 family RNA polymerase sigma factor [Clostridia bacterium]